MQLLGYHCPTCFKYLKSVKEIEIQPCACIITFSDILKRWRCPRWRNLDVHHVRSDRENEGISKTIIYRKLMLFNWNRILRMSFWNLNIKAIYMLLKSQITKRQNKCWENLHKSRGSIYRYWMGKSQKIEKVKSNNRVIINNKIN